MAKHPELVDYSDSRAILIGVSRYHDPDYPMLPAAANSLLEMQAVLTDPTLCGWPRDRIITFPDPENSGRFAQQLRRIAEQTRGVLLLYFVGHGTITRHGKLCLTLTDTEAAGAEFTGLEYSKIRDILVDCPAQTKVAILDCCYSGRAIEALAGAGETQIADSTDIRGVYTLTAADHTAHVVPLEQQGGGVCTSFTAELTALVRSGVADGPSTLTLNFLYNQLLRQLVESNLPRPNQRNTDTADRYPFARNAAADGGTPRKRTGVRSAARRVPMTAALPSSLSADTVPRSTDPAPRPAANPAQSESLWPDPSPAGSLAEFRLALRRTWIRSGAPAHEEMVRRTGGLLNERGIEELIAETATGWSDDQWDKVPLLLEACGVAERLIIEWQAVGVRIRKRTQEQQQAVERAEDRKDAKLQRRDPFFAKVTGYGAVFCAFLFLFGTAAAQVTVKPQLGVGNWVVIALELIGLAFLVNFVIEEAAYFWYRGTAKKAVLRITFLCGVAAFVAGWLAVGHAEPGMAHVGLDVRNWLGWRG